MLFSRRKQDKVPPTQKSGTVAPAEEEKGSLHYLVANLQGRGSRLNQEDAFAFGNALDDAAIAERGLLAVVADGMGGMEDGKLASSTAVAEVLKAFETFDPDGDLPAQLNDALRRAGDAVYGHLGGSGGSTLVLALVFREKLYFSAVGDSDLFLLHDRELTRLNAMHTVFHDVLREQIRNGEMLPDMARAEPEREAITCYAGMPSDPEPDYLRRPLPLHPGDVLMLCSDGVGGVLEPPLIARCLCSSAPEGMCAALNEEIKKKKRKHQDNYTALIIQCRK